MLLCRSEVTRVAAELLYAFSGDCLFSLTSLSHNRADSDTYSDDPIALKII
jgi:hypothetical protein